MAKQGNAKRELRGKARMRAEIVEAARALHKVGAMSDDELQKATMKMLGKAAVPSAEIGGGRARAGGAPSCAQPRPALMRTPGARRSSSTSRRKR